MYYFVSCEKIVASNSGEMRGNSGWIFSERELPEPLLDENGAAYYGYANGEIVTRTIAERALEYPENDTVAPAIETRVERVEAGQSSLEQQLALLLGGDTE